MVADNPSSATMIWEVDVRLLRNRFAWFDVLRAACTVLIAGEVVVAIMSYLTVNKVVLIPLNLLVVGLVLFCLPFGAVGILSHDRLRCRFELSNTGIRFNIPTSYGPVSRFARLLAPLAGSWRAVTSVVFKLYPELIRINWADVYKLSHSPEEGIITVSDSWHSVLRIYTEPAQYGEVSSFCKTHLEAAEKLRGGRSQRRKATLFYPLLSLACIIAALATQAWHWADYNSTLNIGITVALTAILMVNTWMAWWCSLIAIFCSILSLWYLASLTICAFNSMTGGFAGLVDAPRFYLAFAAGCFFLVLCIVRLCDKATLTS
ncbi:MAG: hypothetical protein LLG44_11045 [Chloroflexi bacterium]|nr:hypothetical protein [Chloroflexota bacterium]